MHKLSLAVIFALFACAQAGAADPILGNWRTSAGSTAKIASCEAGICVTLIDGRFAGRQIGEMQPQAQGNYAGKITDPEKDKTYAGKAKVSGDKLEMSGCVLIFCRSQVWTRL